MSAKTPSLMLQVKGENSLDAVPPLFSNFLGVSRAGSDVQFEFIYLDINLIATMLQPGNIPKDGVSPVLEGRTVAKVVMPAASVLQLKDHLVGLLQGIEKDIKAVSENQNVSDRAKSG